MKPSRLFALLLVAALEALSPMPASASSGGDVLPFNPAIETIVGNLTGPTATAFIIIMAIGGLFLLGMSRESPWMKPVGSIIVLGACIAKLPSLLSTLGLTGASAQPMELWLLLLLAAAVAGWCAGILAYVIPSLQRLGACAPGNRGDALK